MNPFDETCKPYKWEVKFYEEEGIPSWECKTHETRKLGKIYSEEDGSFIEAEVHPMPAQFWKFRVYSAESGKTYNISTGSGGLMNYFPVMRSIATGMIVIESIETKDI